MKKTTKAEFGKFVRSFKKWQVAFGIDDWDCSFACCGLGDENARIEYDIDNRTASAKLALELTGDGGGPDKLGKHEAIHLFLAEFASMAGDRYCTKRQLEAEEERLVRLLCRLIPDDIADKRIRGYNDFNVSRP